MSVKFKEPVPCESPCESAGAGGLSPTMDIREADVDIESLRGFVLEFTSFFYHFPRERIVGETRILEDLEVHLYTDGGNEELRYGKIFIDPRHPKTTGLSDRGLSAFLYLNALTDALGIDIADTGDEGGPEGRCFSAATVGELSEALSNLLIQRGEKRIP